MAVTRHWERERVERARQRLLILHRSPRLTQKSNCHPNELSPALVSASFSPSLSLSLLCLRLGVSQQHRGKVLVVGGMTENKSPSSVVCASCCLWLKPDSSFSSKLSTETKTLTEGSFWNVTSTAANADRELKRKKSIKNRLFFSFY